MNSIFRKDTEFTVLKIKALLNSQNAEEINIPFKTMKDYDNWYFYREKYCYFKTMNFGVQGFIYLLNHLVGERIARYFQVPSVHFFLAKAGQDDFGLASYNFRKQGCKYISYPDYWNLSFQESLRFYEEKFVDNPKELHPISPLLRLVAHHIYTDLDELIPSNLFLEQNDRGWTITPVSDYDELSFPESKITSYAYSSSIFDLEIPSKEFEYLLENYPEAREYFKKFLSLNIESILKEIQKEFHLENCDTYLGRYKRNDEIKKEFIHTLHL